MISITPDNCGNELTNLFYTGVSRGKRKVVLYGDPQAVDVAMQKTLPTRKPMLVAKTHMQMQKCAREYTSRRAKTTGEDAKNVGIEENDPQCPHFVVTGESTWGGTGYRCDCDGKIRKYS